LCEFKVFLDGNQVAEDIIYAKQEEGKVIIQDIIGTPKTFEDVEINEVNVFSTRLVLRKRASGG
jgi:predicted RNA-binding protein